MQAAALAQKKQLTPSAKIIIVRTLALTAFTLGRELLSQTFLIEVPSFYKQLERATALINLTNRSARERLQRVQRSALKALKQTGLLRLLPAQTIVLILAALPIIECLLRLKRKKSLDFYYQRGQIQRFATLEGVPISY